MKNEYRNPKQIQMTKIQNLKQEHDELHMNPLCHPFKKAIGVNYEIVNSGTGEIRLKIFQLYLAAWERMGYNENGTSRYK